MKEQFATYEVSKQLKDLGFDQDCFGYYNPAESRYIPKEELGKLLTVGDDKSLPARRALHGTNGTLAPLWQQVKKWLWEKFNIDCLVESHFTNNGNKFMWINSIKDDIICAYDGEPFDSPVTAEIEGIKAAVNHLHKQL